MKNSKDMSMQINEVTPDEYRMAFARYPHIYNTVDFSLLNIRKVENLRYLLFLNPKIRFGIILGERADGCLYSPFSAPFGGFTANKTQYFGMVDEAVIALKSYGRERDKSIVLTLPPFFYDAEHFPLLVNSLHRHAKIRFIDVNYHFHLNDFATYKNIIKTNARNKLQRSMKENFMFLCVERGDESGIRRAYNVIKKNREERGYPLRMSLDDVVKTIKLIPADFFILNHEGNDVAAAQVFHVSEGICQVIYWGDLREYSHLRPMNRLTYHVFEYYYKKGIKVLDIGPSTENGEPNFGLCDFKESIGCLASNKFSFEL